SSAASLRDVLPCACNKLARIRFGDAQDLADFLVRIVEGFSKNIGGSLGGSKFLEQQQHGEFQCLTALCSEPWIGARIDWFRKPDPKVRFPPGPCGLEHVER